ncbi:MAG: hypothetical protein ABIK15_21270 [Pseudomonadota bacterium]
MENQQLIKQAVDFQRNAFNNAFQAVVLFQDQTERATKTLLAQVTLVPEEGKTLIGTWTENYKKGLNQYKEAVDAGFNRIEEFLGTAH